MTYRASNLRRHGETVIPATNLNNTYRIIKEVLKRFRSREAEERERANLVEQDQLVVDHPKGAYRLKDLYIRPNIESKRITGTENQECLDVFFLISLVHLSAMLITFRDLMSRLVIFKDLTRGSSIHIICSISCTDLVRGKP